MADIGYFSLKNDGVFIAKMKFYHLVNGKWVIAGEATDEIWKGNTLKVYPSKYGVALGESVKLHVEVVGGSGKDGSEVFTYGRFNEDIAEYTISGTSLINTLKFNRINVQTIHPTGVSLKPTSLSLEEGFTAGLTETVTPSNATNKRVTWKSGDEKVVTVDKYGGLYAKAVGTAIITATTDDGGHKAQCTVTVTPSLPTGISLVPTSITLRVGDVVQALTATITPSNPNNKPVTWKSSKPSVVEVDQHGDGWLKAKAVGTATITVTVNGHSATCEVTVTPYFSSGKGTCYDPYIISTAEQFTWLSKEKSEYYDKYFKIG
jgi:hypothetical protein